MQERRDQMRADRSHDPTKSTRKLADPTVCPDCGASYHEGRWTWRPGPVDAPRRRCSACERIRDDYPAGFVTIGGRFAREHRDEILRLAQNTEEREKQDHPINRIIGFVEEDDTIVVRTTETHLAQAIGKALRSAYQGELELGFEEDVVRVRWWRDE